MVGCGVGGSEGRQALGEYCLVGTWGVGGRLMMDFCDCRRGEEGEEVGVGDLWMHDE